MWLLAIGVMARGAFAQPPLPPEERPSVFGAVTRLSAADGIALDTGLAAPLVEGVRIAGAENLAAIAPGDLVEITQDANGLVVDIRVVPRLAQRTPLVTMATTRTPLSRFWWTHDGREFPDSLYAADAAISLQAAGVLLEGTVAYLPPDATDAAEFAVLDNAGTVLWSTRVAAGNTAPLKCALPGAAFALRCRRADGSTPDHTHCIWGSPTVLLKELGSIPLPPGASADLAAKLDAALKGVDAGAIGIAQPRVIGLSPQMARDLQCDLLVALGRRRPIVGCVPWEAVTTLTEAQIQAATKTQATSVAAPELRYSPDGSVVKLALVHVASREVLASVETTVKP
ncbi:MAG: hypothetical protein FJX75_14270 [Armatimonadetes bacterium]|nr:hypothetical protein [Armatimonadota bacterium]